MRIIEAAGLAQIRLLHHELAQFDLVGQYLLTNTDAIDTAPGIDSNNHANAQGDIQFSIKRNLFISFLAFAFESWIDWVEISVELVFPAAHQCCEQDSLPTALGEQRIH